jgi:dihydropteroate synthase
MGHKVLVGASRKRFLGTLLTVSGKAALPAERDAATAAVTAISAAGGAWAVRVHDVESSLDAVKVAARMAPRPGH